MNDDLGIDKILDIASANQEALPSLEEIEQNQKKMIRTTSLNNMSSSKLCKYMGYENLAHFLRLNPLEATAGVSKRKLLQLAKEGHTSNDSLMGISRMLEDEIKKLTPLEREEFLTRLKEQENEEAEFNEAIEDALVEDTK